MVPGWSPAMAAPEVSASGGLGGREGVARRALGVGPVRFLAAVRWGPGGHVWSAQSLAAKWSETAEDSCAPRPRWEIGCGVRPCIRGP